MKKGEYLSLTLVEVSRLLRHKERLRQREYDIPSARLAAIILNMFRNEDEKPEAFTLQDIVPYLELAKAEPISLEEQQLKHAEELLLKVRAMTLRFGGSIDLETIPN